MNFIKTQQNTIMISTGLIISGSTLGYIIDDANKYEIKCIKKEYENKITQMKDKLV